MDSIYPFVKINMGTGELLLLTSQAIYCKKFV